MIFQSTPASSRVVANQFTATAPMKDFPSPWGPRIATRRRTGMASRISDWYLVRLTSKQSAAQHVGQFIHRETRERASTLEARSMIIFASGSQRTPKHRGLRVRVVQVVTGGEPAPAPSALQHGPGVLM